jgi:hypothetical protein
MSCVGLEESFNVQLKKIYKSGGSRYELQLCCPVIVNLVNDCPRDMVAIKVPKCFISNDVVYDVESPRLTPIQVNYTNQTLCESEDPAICIPNENCWFIFIKTDKVLQVNDLCITKFNIPVVPSCLDSEKITSPVPIEDVVTFEYYDDADLSGYYDDTTVDAILQDCIDNAYKNKDDLVKIQEEINDADSLQEWAEGTPGHPAYPHLLLDCLDNN